MYIVVSRTHTMTLCISKNKISWTIRTSLSTKKLTRFTEIVTKPVDIVFDPTSDKIKEVNRKYVAP